MTDSLLFTDVLSCTLVDQCASDLAVVNAARISFDVHHPILEAGDEKLISFLMRNGHGSPFEHGYFKFLMEMPIFEFRNQVRHRAGHSYNEMSGRYTKLNHKFYLPKTARIQVGKPGEYSFEELPSDSQTTQDMQHVMTSLYEEAWDTYEDLLTLGVAKEQARIVLPVGVYTKVIWSCNPRSLMNFIELRSSSHAMKEVRSIALQAEQALITHMPITHKAFNDNGRTAP